VSGEVGNKGARLTIDSLVYKKITMQGIINASYSDIAKISDEAQIAFDFSEIGKEKSKLAGMIEISDKMANVSLVQIRCQ